MGIFGRKFDKPGKGVDINAPEKKGFFRFWEMVFEKFWGHIKAALISALASVPILFLVFCFAPIAPITSIFKDQQLYTSADFLLRFLLVSIYYTLWGCGPASTAYAYVTKCHTLRKPVWPFSDGFKIIKSNFKQSILLALISLIALQIGCTALFEYFQNNSVLYFILRTIVCIVILIYTWAQFYIYQVMTTMNLKFKHIWKNAIFFAFSSVPMNILFTIISIGGVILCYTFFQPIFAFMLTLIIAPIFTRLPIEFYATRKIAKAINDFEKTKANEDKEL